MAKKKTCFIYTITDPINNEIFYVGKTQNPEERFYCHSLNSLLTTLYYKIEEIKSAGGKLLFTIVEECKSDIYREREKFWIKKLFSEGHPLLNAELNKKVSFEIKVADGINYTPNL